MRAFERLRLATVANREAEDDSRRLFADKGEVLRGEVADCALDTLGVVVGETNFRIRAEVRLAGVGEAETELGQPAEFLWREEDRRHSQARRAVRRPYDIVPAIAGTTADRVPPWIAMSPSYVG